MKILLDLMAVAGLSALGVGLWMISPPASLIGVGAILYVSAMLIAGVTR